ncbi:oligosaccharide flippase family protein [Deinococcus altitudinis]|uniref:oligosaccharide flippase family protein n=1 Tax=Deinococcus altitudinis TaxID=468914 RepID=UPI00389170E0
MSSVDTDSILESASKSGLFLVLRQIIVQLLNILTGFLLGRFLTPSEYAINSIITIVIAFLLAFGGTGIAVSLIRKKEEPSSKEYEALGTIQMFVVAIFAVSIFFVAPYISNTFSYGFQGSVVFRILAFSVLLVGLAIIPQVKLERNLEFNKIAIIEVVQVVVYSSVVVVLTYLKFGILSFGYAILLRYVAGLIVTYRIQPWRPRLVFSFAEVAEHLRFGLYFQSSQIINLIKDTAVPLFIGTISGAAAVGYIAWATMVMNYPALAIIIFNRIYLPLFSRIAPDKEKFHSLLNVLLTLTCSLVFFASSLIYVFRVEINLILFKGAWTEALVLFLPFLFINILLAPTMIVSQAVYALGDSKSNFVLMILWTVSTWLLVIVVLPRFGWKSWGWVNLMVNSFNLYMWWRLYDQSKFNVLKPIAIPAITTLMTVCLTFVLGEYNMGKAIIIVVLIGSFILLAVINVRNLKILSELKS